MIRDGVGYGSATGCGGRRMWKEKGLPVHYLTFWVSCPLPWLYSSLRVRLFDRIKRDWTELDYSPVFGVHRD